jgi:hypothetical protein
VALEQCEFLDGRSAERVGRFVVEELADVCGSSRTRAAGETPAVARR